MKNVVLFQSQRRFDAFKATLEQNGDVILHLLTFDTEEWSSYDFSNTDAIIYFPSFEYTSNHPLALSRVKDNLTFIHAQFPDVRMFPDPKLIPYYADKYRQHLFLKAHDIPYPETYALLTESDIDSVGDKLGFPLIAKNRFGAGGNYVYEIRNKTELETYYRLSVSNFWNVAAATHFFGKLFSRSFLYHLIRERRMEYPFLSSPLLAQKFTPHNRDLKIVIFEDMVVEAHWRRRADDAMWKMNIDGGAIGEWSFVPESAIDVAQCLSAKLGATWLNIDLIQADDQQFLVSEFSPVWHHYKFKEKKNFVYRDDYNIGVPLEKALDLESLIVGSLF